MNATFEEICSSIRDSKDIDVAIAYLDGIENLKLFASNYQRRYDNDNEKYFIEISDREVRSSYSMDRFKHWLTLIPDSSEVIGYSLFVKYQLVVANKFVDYIADVLYKHKIEAEAIEQNCIKKFGNIFVQDADLLKKYNLKNTEISLYITTIGETELAILIDEIQKIVSSKI